MFVLRLLEHTLYSKVVVIDWGVLAFHVRVEVGLCLAVVGALAYLNFCYPWTAAKDLFSAILLAEAMIPMRTSSMKDRALKGWSWFSQRCRWRKVDKKASSSSLRIIRVVSRPSYLMFANTSYLRCSLVKHWLYSSLALCSMRPYSLLLIKHTLRPEHLLLEINAIAMEAWGHSFRHDLGSLRCDRRFRSLTLLFLCFWEPIFVFCSSGFSSRKHFGARKKKRWTSLTGVCFGRAFFCWLVCALDRLFFVDVLLLGSCRQY